MDEIWKPIPGYEGLYEASNLGRIRSVDRELVQRNNKGSVSVFRRKGRILAQRMSSAGYLRVNLSKDDEHSTHHVHKLICLAFYGVPESGRDQAAHNDGTRTNNVLSNLRWATTSENMQDKNLHGTDMRGGKHPKAKLNWESVRSIRASNDNAPALAASHGVGVSAIHKIRYGYTWKEEHAGAA